MIALFIIDEVQLTTREIGLTYEVIISRTWYVSAQMEIKMCIVACHVSVANASELGEWIGAPLHAIFNFLPGQGSHWCTLALFTTHNLSSS